MEITKRAKFVTDFYGSKGYLEGDQLVRGWIDSLLHKTENPNLVPVSRALDNEKELAKMLKVFNLDDNDYPIIGGWMLFRCSLAAQKLAGTWNKYKVSAEAWKSSVQITPHTVNIYRNGHRITEAEDLIYYATTVKSQGKPRSFFAAYQTIKPGAEFEFTIQVPDELIVEKEIFEGEVDYVPQLDDVADCVNDVLEKMQLIGVGAFRERFGKFVFINT